MIRDAILHLNNEQPMLADLFDPPSPGDVGLRCTNLRQMNGTRPVFIDDTASIFFFPYLHIRFVEIPPKAMAEVDPSMALATADAERRGRGAAAPGVSGPSGSDPDPDLDTDLEIDEDFLRRIREA